MFISCKKGNTQKTLDIEEIKELTTAEKIANAHGFEHWNKVSRIDFTFSIHLDNSSWVIALGVSRLNPIM